MQTFLNLLNIDNCMNGKKYNKHVTVLVAANMSKTTIKIKNFEKFKFKTFFATKKN